MKTLIVVLVLLPIASGSVWSQGRQEPLAKEGPDEGTQFRYHRQEGFYRAYLDCVRQANVSLPKRDAVLMLGHVKKSGELPIRESLTVSQAVAEAEGKSFADLRHVGVWRDRDGWFLIVNVSAIRRHEVDVPDPKLEGGDVVVVLEKLIGF